MKRIIIIGTCAMVVLIQCACATEIGRDTDEIRLAGRRTSFTSKVNNLKMKMNKILMGTAQEDIVIDLTTVRRTSLPAQTFPLPSTTPIEETENLIEGMMKMMKVEREDVKSVGLMQDLMEVAQAINNTQDVTTREESASAFKERVKNLLAVSGIEALLPLDCGRNPLNKTSSLGGLSFPWVAALGSREDGIFYYRCIGMVITQYHIITDAECASSPNINIAQLNTSRIPSDSNSFEAFVVGRRIHPSIKDKGDFLNGNNIGVLELAHPLPFNDYIQPICLPGVFEEDVADKLEETTLIGFRLLGDTPQGRAAGIFSWRRSRTFDAATCYTDIKVFNKENPDLTSMLFTILTKNHICISRPFEVVGKSMAVKEDPETRRVKLIGVGPVANARNTVPIAYSLVQPHRFWIELIIKKFKDNTTRRS